MDYTEQKKEDNEDNNDFLNHGYEEYLHSEDNQSEHVTEDELKKIKELSSNNSYK